MRSTGRQPAIDHAVHEAIGHSLSTGEITVPLHVGVDPLHRLAGVLGVDLIDSRT